MCFAQGYVKSVLNTITLPRLAWGEQTPTHRRTYTHILENVAIVAQMTSNFFGSLIQDNLYEIAQDKKMQLRYLFC